jgi:hypothetical protein
LHWPGRMVPGIAASTCLCLTAALQARCVLNRPSLPPLRFTASPGEHIELTTAAAAI